MHTNNPWQAEEVRNGYGLSLHRSTVAPAMMTSIRVTNLQSMKIIWIDPISSRKAQPTCQKLHTKGYFGVSDHVELDVLGRTCYDTFNYVVIQLKNILLASKSKIKASEPAISSMFLMVHLNNT